MPNPILDDDQRLVAHAPDPFCGVLAGPGSGKTTTLAARAVHLVTSGAFRPGEVVMMTYTRAMAGDLRRRVAEMMPPEMACVPCAGAKKIDGAICSACMGTGVTLIGEMLIGTMHSVASRMVTAALRGDIAGGANVRATGWLRDVAKAMRFAMPEDVDDLCDLAQGIVGKKKITKKALREGLLLQGPDLDANPPASELRRQLLVRDLVTYDDVIKMLEIVCAHGRATSTTERIGQKYPAILLDERQDLTTQHWQILASWAPRSLMAVGDDAQAIFGFLDGRGDGAVCNVDLGASFTLHGNYRSGTEIVQHGNDVRAALTADGCCAPMEQAARRDDPGRVLRLCPDDEEDAPRAAADAIAAALDDGFAPEDVGVLAAKWDDLDPIADELAAIGVEARRPDEAAGRKAWATDSGRAIVSIARSAASNTLDRYDAQIIARAVHGVAEGDRLISKAWDEAFALDTALHSALGPSAWSDVVKAATMPAIVAIARELGVPNVDRLAAQIDAWLADDPSDTSIGAWLAWLACGHDSEPAVQRGVALRSIHSAKGLEWPVVVVLNACEGGIPPAWGSKTEAQIAEWARALFVAATRARDRLIVISPRELRGKPRQPSKWLPRTEK